MKAVLFSIFFLTLSFSKSLFSESDSLSQLKKQMAASTDAASDSGEDLMAIDYLQGKLLAPVDANGNPKLDASGKQILPAWYPHFYPSAEEMSPTSTAKPKLRVFQGLSASDSKLVPEWEVFREDKLGNCVRLNGSILLYSSKNSAPTACLNYVKSYQLDLGGLSGIQLLNSSGQLATDPEENGFQSGFVGVVDMKQLTQAQKDQMFSTPSAVPPKSVGAINPKKVIFRKYVADENNSQKLAAIEVQVGSTLARVPVPSTNFPPAPRCQIQVLSAQPVQRGATVQFNLLADSIARGGAIGLDNGKEALLVNSNLRNNPISDIGNFVAVNQSPLTLTLTQADFDDNRIRRSVNTARPNEQIWTISGRVNGVDSSVPSSLCSTSLRIDFVIAPDCSLTFDRSELLNNETTTARLDCSRGGAVSSAVIKTYRGSEVTSATFKNQRNLTTSSGSTNLSGISSKQFTFQHTKQELVLGETVVVDVTGPGGTRSASAALGDVCPYNNTSFVRSELPPDNYFYWWNYGQNTTTNGVWSCPTCVAGSIDLPAIDFTMGSSRYSRTGTVRRVNSTQTRSETVWLWTQPASSYDWIDNDWAQNRNTCILADGSWGGCWTGGAGAEACNSDNFCMMTVQYSDNDYSTTAERRDYTQGGIFFWVEVGREDGRDGGKYDPNCRMKVVKTREGGCFSGRTSLLMADGSQRKISDIMEGDLVLNPHYQTGVRVRKVVKGPEKKSLYEVQIGKNKVEVTEDHPFLTQRGWVQAMDLKAGDKLFGEGNGKVVAQSRKLPYKGPEDVWNFELDTEDPLARVVVANGVPTGELSTQLELKKVKKLFP